MLKNKILVSSILVIFMIFSILSCTSYGESVVVTEDNLKTAVENVLAIEENGGRYTATVENNNIKVFSNSKEYNLQYSLEGKPTFTYNIPVTTEMTYEEFSDKTEKLILPMAGYMAVANVQGLTVNDCLAYLSTLYIMGTFNNFSADVAEDASTQFEANKVEYAKSLYGTEKTIKDNGMLLGINSFELTTKLEDVSDTACNIVSTVSVDINANYATLMNNGDEGDDGEGTPADGSNAQEEQDPGTTSTPEPSAPQQVVEKIDKIDDTQATKSIPQTGANGSIFIIISAVVGVAIISCINVMKNRDIK